MRDSYQFEDVLKEIEDAHHPITNVDCSRISFIEPYSMLCLLLIGRNYIRNYGRKLKLINIPVNIHQYLARMDFIKTGIFDIDTPLNEKMFLKRNSMSSRIIEILEIPNKERESVRSIAGVIDLFRKRASYILKFWISEGITDYFVTVISELCQNIFEHSLDSGYISMQTYDTGKNRVFRLAIADSGVGIEGSFRNNLAHFRGQSSELIKAVFTTPISSKREFGFGLCQVNAVVEKFNGSLYIRSNNASATAVYDNKTVQNRKGCIFLKNDLKEFNGTQISVTLSA